MPLGLGPSNSLLTSPRTHTLILSNPFTLWQNGPSQSGLIFAPLFAAPGRGPQGLTSIVSLPSPTLFPCSHESQRYSNINNVSGTV